MCDLSWRSLDVISRRNTDFLATNFPNILMLLCTYFTEQADACLRLKLHFSSFRFPCVLSWPSFQPCFPSPSTLSQRFCLSFLLHPASSFLSFPGSKSSFLVCFHCKEQPFISAKIKFQISKVAKKPLKATGFISKWEVPVSICFTGRWSKDTSPHQQ